MKNEHLQFVTKYMRLKDKEAAYKIAYPDSQPESAYSSAKRLLTRPDIKEYLDETYDRMRKEAEEEIKDEMKGEILSAHNAQVILSQIITGQHVISKEVNVKGKLETIEVRPTHAAIISALNVFFRLNSLYPQKKPAAERKQEELAALREQQEADYKILRAKLPPWPVNPKHPHPYGDTYPLSYRGPYFDPDDPNTREQFLTLMERFRKEAVEQGETTQPYDKHLQHRTVWSQQYNERTNGFHNQTVAATAGNNMLISSSEQAEGDDHSRSSGNIHIPVPATIGNNQQQSVLPFMLQSPWIPTDGGYVTITKALEYCYKDCESKRPCSSILYNNLQLLSRGINKHPNIRAAAERDTGWQYHPVEHYLIRPKLDRQGQ